MKYVNVTFLNDTAMCMIRFILEFSNKRRFNVFCNFLRGQRFQGCSWSQFELHRDGEVSGLRFLSDTKLILDGIYWLVFDLKKRVLLIRRNFLNL